MDGNNWVHETRLGCVINETNGTFQKASSKQQIHQSQWWIRGRGRVHSQSQLVNKIMSRGCAVQRVYWQGVCAVQRW